MPAITSFKSEDAFNIELSTYSISLSNDGSSVSYRLDWCAFSRGIQPRANVTILCTGSHRTGADYARLETTTQIAFGARDFWSRIRKRRSIMHPSQRADPDAYWICILPPTSSRRRLPCHYCHTDQTLTQTSILALSLSSSPNQNTRQLSIANNIQSPNTAK